MTSRHFEESARDLDDVTANVLPDGHVRPDRKAQRYDRQLRLWASAGQAALETASILLISATPTGVEALKNLVLPGFGRYTIQDDQLVTSADISGNFFLTQESLGRNRASECARFLNELNEMVKGSADERSLATLIQEEPDFVGKYTLVLLTGTVNLKTLLFLSERCWELDTSLVVVESSGFYGKIRLQYKEHCVIESHPDPNPDFRLDKPWPELSRLLSCHPSFDLASEDRANHSHIPYPSILFQTLSSWRQSHGGKLPTTPIERRMFKDTINDARKFSDEENFDQALASAYRAWTESSIPIEITRILEVSRQVDLQDVSDSNLKFWLLVKALDRFVQDPQSGGLLPLAGTLPDMHCQTSDYVILQETYKARAREDIAVLRTHLDAVVARSLMPSGQKSLSLISDDELGQFAKNSASLKLIHTTSIAQEYKDENYKNVMQRELDVAQELGESNSLVGIYCAFRAVALARQGQQDQVTFGARSLEPREVLDQMVSHNLDDAFLDMVCQNRDLKKHLLELLRGAFSDLPNMAALLGGIASQEIIKLVTKQYVPANNTLVFDGISSRSRVFEL